MRVDKTFLNRPKPAKIYEGWVARTHDESSPLIYSSGKEFRTSDELENILRQVQECATGRVIPVTNDHPSGLIAADGADSDAPVIGRILGGRLDEDHVIAYILVEDEEAIADIDAGKIQLSLGYTSRKSDDHYQQNISLNHLSLVDQGRARTAELRADSHDPYHKDTGGKPVAQTVPDANLLTSMKVAQLEYSLTLDAKSEETLNRVEAAFGKLSAMSAPKAEAAETPQELHVDCSCKSQTNVLLKDEHAMDELKAQLDAAVKALEVANARVAALETEVATKVDSVETALTLEKAEAKVDAATARIDALTAELATAKAEVEAAKATRSDDDAKEFAAKVDARVTLLDQANKVGIEGAKALSDVEIKLAVIKKVRNKDVKADADVKYVDGMFDIAMDQFEESQTSVVETFEAIEENKEVILDALNHDPLKAERDATARRLAASKNRWKQ